MYNTLQDLRRLEKKLKAAPDLPEIIYFPRHLRHWANVGVGLYIAELDVIFIDNKLKRGQKIANKLITIYLILHELAHSTAHPKRLHRRYMSSFGFDSMRSLNKYIREWDACYRDSECFKDEDNINEYKEEILADKCAMHLYRWLGLPKIGVVTTYYNAIDDHRRKLKLRTTRYEEEAKNIKRQSEKCIRFLKEKLSKVLDIPADT
jgi:hypothetical protein